MSHTRTLTGTIHRPSGEPWAYFTLWFTLTPSAVTSHATLPSSKVAVTTGLDGTFAVELETGVAYEVAEMGAIGESGSVTRYPVGTRYTIVVPEGATPISIETVRAAAISPSPDPTLPNMVAQVASDLTAHENDHANPHVVTAAQLADLDSEIGASADVAANTAARHTHANKSTLDATTASYTTAEQSKLSGIATGATANATDAQLRDRATHTGTQAIGTVTGLQAALDSLDGLETDVAGKADTTYVNAQLGTKVNTNDVQAVVADAIALDDTVALAAAAAVDDEIEGRDILEAAPITEDDVVFSVVDEGGRRTWIEAAPDGGLTAYAEHKISERIVGAVDIGDNDANGLSVAIVDEDGRRTWIEAALDGKPSDRSLALIGDGLGILTERRIYPTDDWAHWGDSLTQLPTGNTVTHKMALLTGHDHYNGGIGGQTAREIAARQGAVPVFVTVTDNEIPASGSVEVTSISPDITSNEGFTIAGSLNGVEGSVKKTDGVVAFTRSATGSAVPTSPGSAFVPSAGFDSYADRHTAIWIGRNDLSVERGLPVELVISDIQQMIGLLTPRVRRVLVLEVTPIASETTGSGARTALDAFNAAMQAAFPQYWAPVATWLRTEDAADAANITFTSDDETDISNGVIPRSLRSDGTHLNAAGATAAAAYLYELAHSKGWL